MSSKNRASSRNVEGLITDCLHLLEQSGVLQAIEAKKTGEAQCLIEIRCKPASAASTLPELAAEIERVWLEDLAYPDIEAHTLSTTSDEAIIDFVTASQHGNYYVTGKIVVKLHVVR
jgi:hypothetical protein